MTNQTELWLCPDCRSIYAFEAERARIHYLTGDQKRADAIKRAIESINETNSISFVREQFRRAAATGEDLYEAGEFFSGLDFEDLREKKECINCFPVYAGRTFSENQLKKMAAIGKLFHLKHDQ